VQFSESCSCRIISETETTFSEEADASTEVVLAHSESNISGESSANLQVPSQCSTPTTLSESDGSVVEKDKDFAFPMKTEDGPSPANLTAEALVLHLLRQRRINRQQVQDHLLRATSPTPPKHCISDTCDPRFNTATADVSRPHDSEVSAAVASGCNGCIAGAVDDGLRTAVHARLLALCDRLDARGRVALLPSTTVLRREFLPGLRFLLAATEAHPPAIAIMAAG
jgi:hypothetical protein